MWLDHRPANAVELGTVMQPLMKQRKSVTKLTDAKDVANSKTSKYCLMTQEQDSSGELETRLYKVICLFVCISVYIQSLQTLCTLQDPPVFYHV